MRSIVRSPLAGRSPSCMPPTRIPGRNRGRPKSLPRCAPRPRTPIRRPNCHQPRPDTCEGLMRIAVIGGGPAGLYFSALVKQLDAAHEITIWERNAPDDTFGFGVVFSDETLGGIEHADEHVYRRMAEQF